ncbi:multifunctional oxoglutarate decarboxylase/oxoglutarate dehydrogenase thiamine pyrophosphate-binding subunit/dihydrolipoyllysine-residue succinyltransferase subunit [Streptomyces fructofermentans]|uniref:multifunctional oxoglutarate decarboxylase/oxoglutarate dehydrogenase thiamine pyrophosphate-binding subunit/dihydrolipoyllysine-residue succinyltransferase subunit n=1 Tax=Streptomyces fructofermentans TaxID=152141 RepID=UPI003402351F
MTSRSDTLRTVIHGLDFGPNEWVVDEQRQRYLLDPGSVDATWRDFFASAAQALVPAVPGTRSGGPGHPAADQAPADVDEAALKAVRVAALIHAYRVRGHLMADTDPIGPRPAAVDAELDITAFGLQDNDRTEDFVVDGFGGRATMTLDEVVGALREFYCRSAGFEYMHISSSQERHWIQQHVESPRRHLDRAQQLRILDRLGAAEAFETFLHTKYVGHKRYSLEGGESAIVLLDALLLGAIEDGMGEAVIGMAHRGRLNVLANIVGKSNAQIFGEFEDSSGIGSVQGSGDVKYHLGAEGTYHSPLGGAIGVSVVANPSHLEIVGPVVQGVARAKQDTADGSGPTRVLPVVVHGDAAFAGQGVVAETLNMSRLPGYRTGGTVHVVINNQVGFTTLPASGRSSTYATDVARMVDAPILHVNGDDPEEVDRVARLAFDYRRTFHKDVVVELVCYRRHGHSEVDDPSITQPLMYDRIDAMASVRTAYAEALIRHGDISQQHVEDARRDYREQLDRAFAETRALAASGSVHETRAAGSEGSGPGPLGAGPVRTAAPRSALPAVTAIDEATARRVIASQTDFPRGFTVHPRVLPQLHRRTAALDQGTVDWATAETLAIGSLLLEGVPVRLAGQDSRRGTFGQRHAVLTDRRTGTEHMPLGSLGPDAAHFTPFDSSLSEQAALAFEYGYALARPEALVLWEAQFGDFANGAQTVVDEYIASSEQKWGRRSAVTLLLPHGLEGQGPDHSSARIERFLQLCAQDNMTVAMPSLPGNYFHLLRQQALGGTRPLVVLTPKSMLRSKAATSSLDEFTGGGFRPLLPDRTVDPERVTRVLVCSGKVSHELDTRRRESGSTGTAIVRVERLYPFAEEDLAAELARFPASADVRWVQEEAENQGAWTFLAPRLHRAAGRLVECVSREAAPAPAVGSARRHALEQRALVESAFR